ncbi:putative membrane protein [Lachnospiraceae bacterium PF1-21]|uniref:DUF1700 domain-containing protein n=1 Tax=Ohessyouella blattaphilus TaxID=2949333 RepID=A0ABT1EI74_9FIRM|nr:DUF1700 domain-containing protein [Ohessyouella blattaphilus]MCP1109007.1 DUF1700 domain-containing protein [Ohessyouella blattaphilus]MCR8562401.1 DUF1700 domain-containing protein [Ohessyouella blattaphilus]MDL2249744.1 DUF1700 domain-containing protein [Lachnospiraceae bacterium OttesenSCG-928-J05]
MTKSEFLERLKEALENDINGPVVQENINYYSQYIDDEVRNGREEAAVIEELGDPWVLSKTIIDSVEIKTKQSNTYSQGTYSNSSSQTNQSSSQGASGSSSGGGSGFSGKLKLILIILVVVAVVMGIFSLVVGAFSAMAPVLVPILLIVFIVRLFSNRR